MSHPDDRSGQLSQKQIEEARSSGPAASSRVVECPNETWELLAREAEGIVQRLRWNENEPTLCQDAAGLIERVFSVVSPGSVSNVLCPDCHGHPGAMETCRTCRGGKDSVPVVSRPGIEDALLEDCDRLRHKIRVMRDALQAARNVLARHGHIEAVAGIDEALSFVPPDVTPKIQGQRWLWRHTKRGTLYEKIGTAELQASTRVLEPAQLTIYRGEDGKLWARPVVEFEDGRFELVSVPKVGDQ